MTISHSALWQQLCALLVEDARLGQTVGDYLADPDAYFAAHEDDLLQRGIEEAEELNAWLVVVDWLESNEMLIELDWSADSDELVEELQGLTQFPDEQFDASFEPATELVPALTDVDAMLQTRGMHLLYLDIDSDSYPLVLVPSANAEPIRDVAAQLGQHVELPGRSDNGWTLRALRG
ncbi:DUF6630 family protein [Glaciibacter psychrotolerans]|uniref:DUF6630 domain-containing protein n=1 Tax=Glaciibacter psychrotolerans TaxID=670054 RepID=A0A7Z0EGN9_9MICO|nr:DUF6630 family protein [Leifsonia psychrotolerans]NYJ20564.1 hypothetical protein [Leifsonia psychrotolerans]